MFKIGLLIIIAIFAPAGTAYSPAKPHINKPTSVAVAHKAPQSQISNDKPLVHSAIPVTSFTGSSHYTSKAAPASEGSVAATPTTEGNAETPAAPCNPNDLPADYEECQKDANSSKCYDTSQCLDPDRPYFDGFGNEYNYDGTVLQYAPQCAPTADAQDPCKLGQCFGYPYGICESNPNQGELAK